MDRKLFPATMIAMIVATTAASAAPKTTTASGDDGRTLSDYNIQKEGRPIRPRILIRPQLILR